MKRRNLTTGRIEHVRYPWTNKAPIYRMGKRKATEVKRTSDPDPDGPKPPPPMPPS